MKPTLFRFRRIVALLVVPAGLLQPVAPCQAETVVFGPPEAQGDPNGNTGFDVFVRGPARFQQVYDASIFQPLVESGGGWIYEVDFRPNGQPVGATVARVQLNMSTTASAPDSLNTFFDLNVGRDDTQVFGPRSLTLLGDLQFQLWVTLPQPFFYNPAIGNLLLDFRIYQGIEPFNRAELDAFELPGDSVSSLYAFGGAAGLPATGQLSTLGLATAFHIIPVPEPSTMVLLTLGLTCLAVVGWKRTLKG
jgi:hypothetical protein